VEKTYNLFLSEKFSTQPFGFHNNFFLKKNYGTIFLVVEVKDDLMKPLAEFIIACVLLLVAGCSAIAGIFSAGIWAAVFAAGSIAALILILLNGTNTKS
jgi:hypothetical protein